MDLSGWIEIGTAVLGVLGPAVGAVLWSLYKSVRDDARAAKAQAEAQKNELTAYKLYVAEHYVTQNDLTKAVANLEKSIDRLIEAVNQASKETRESIGALQARIDDNVDKRAS